MIAEVAGPERVGAATGFAITFVACAIALSPPLYGLVADLTGTYRAIWLVLAAILVVALVPADARARVHRSHPRAVLEMRRLVSGLASDAGDDLRVVARAIETAARMTKCTLPSGGGGTLASTTRHRDEARRRGRARERDELPAVPGLATSARDALDSEEDALGTPLPAGSSQRGAEHAAAARAALQLQARRACRRPPGTPPQGARLRSRCARRSSAAPNRTAPSIAVPASTTHPSERSRHVAWASLAESPTGTRRRMPGLEACDPRGRRGRFAPMPVRRR